MTGAKKDSFIRQLNNYGFRKDSHRSSHKQGLLVFEHDSKGQNFFVKSRPELTKNIERSNHKKSKPTTGLKKENEELRIQNEELKRKFQEVEDEKFKLEKMHGKYISQSVHGKRVII